MLDSLSPVLLSVIYAVGIGIAGSLVAFVISRAFSKLTKKAWGRFTGSFFAVTVIAWTIKLILDVTGAVGVLVIFGTALTGALSLGSENLFSDIVAGVKLIVTRPFQTGDRVAVAGCEGDVLDIALTYIVLLGDNGNQLIVRNSDIFSGTIVNYLKGTDRQISVEIEIPVSPDLDKAVTGLLAALKNFSPQSTNEATKPDALCEKVVDGRMRLQVYAFVSSDLDRNEEITRLMSVSLRALTQNVSLG